jgi:hypothetical protein
MVIFNNGVKTKNIKITPVEALSGNFVNIKPASEFIPEWYRKTNLKALSIDTELLPQYVDSINSTYKKCTPFLDAMTCGYMSFLTADIEVSLQSNGMPYIQWRTERKVITEHALEQWAGLPCPDGYAPFVYKWHNQMSINVDKGYSLLFTTPLNRFDLPFINVSGIVDVDYYENTVHFPFFIKKGFTGIIESGTPISHIIPIKRDPWKLEVMKEDVLKKKIFEEKYLSTIKRSYKNNIWNRKEYK